MEHGQRFVPKLSTEMKVALFLKCVGDKQRHCLDILTLILGMSYYCIISPVLPTNMAREQHLYENVSLLYKRTSTRI